MPSIKEKRITALAGVVGLYHDIVTPSDTVDFEMPCRAIYVGTGGDVSAVDMNGNTVTYVGVPSGTFIHGAFTRINATGTTATNIVRQW